MRLWLPIAALFVAATVLAQTFQGATLGADGFAWVTLDDASPSPLPWNVESGTVETMLGTMTFGDAENLHEGSDTCVTVHLSRVWNVYAEVLFELDESGTREVSIVRRKSNGTTEVLATGGTLAPDQAFQMRVAASTSQFLWAGECIEVWATARDHGDPSGLFAKGNVLSVYREIGGASIRRR